MASKPSPNAVEVIVSTTVFTSLLRSIRATSIDFGLIIHLGSALMAEVEEEENNNDDDNDNDHASITVLVSQDALDPILDEPADDAVSFV
ncbi:hypothetical protein EDD11_001232 [Mortierella claussenii]|nr:hypothetical protein EDD11_001232 [Mortierella claussenii]